MPHSPFDCRHAHRHTLGRRAALSAALAATGSLTACGVSPVLKSDPVTAGVGQAGLVYALPKAQARITLERQIVTAEALADALGKQKKAVEKVESAAKLATETKSTADGLKAVFDQAKEPGRTELSKQVTIAQATATVAAAQLAQAKVDAKAAEAAAEALKDRVGQCMVRGSLALLEPVPDWTRRFVAVRHARLTRDDDLQLALEGGLLNTVESTATDQTATVLANLAQALVAPKTLKGNNLFSLKVDKGKEKPEPANLCVRDRASLSFDPTLSAEYESAAALAGTWNLRLEIHPPLDDTPGSKEPPAAMPADGLFYRAHRPVTLRLKPDPTKVPDGKNLDDDAVVSGLVPDARTLFVLDFNAASLVKTVQKVSFAKGMPTGQHITAPSRLAAVSRLPVDILKAVLEVPASLIKLRVDIDTQANALQAQQLTQLENQVKLLDAQQTLRDRLASEP